MRTLKLMLLLPLIALTAASLSGTATLQAPARQITPLVSLIARVPGVVGITTDKSGNIYAVSNTENTITRLSPEGKILGKIGPSISAGVNLRISSIQHPIHVDSAGRIYTPSGGYLLILDQKGNLLNAGTEGTILDGFKIAHILWLGTDTVGHIYIYPAIGDKASLITALTSDGTRLSNFGDTVLPAESKDIFFIAMDSQDNVYAAFSRFAAMMKYGPDRKMQHLVKLQMSERIEEQSEGIGDRPIEQVLRELPTTGNMRGNRLIRFLDICALDRNTVLCLTGDEELRWYSGDGQVLRVQRISDYFHGPGTYFCFDKLARGLEGNYIIGLDKRQGELFKLSLK